MTDTWPEDARDWMHRGLVNLPKEIFA
jgi:hypothetical protein